jgi:hypothetical protein
LFSFFSLLGLDSLYTRICLYVFILGWIPYFSTLILWVGFPHISIPGIPRFLPWPPFPIYHLIYETPPSCRSHYGPLSVVFFFSPF